MGNTRNSNGAVVKATATGYNDLVLIRVRNTKCVVCVINVLE